MIVITAPTSSIGSQVLENILDGGEPIRVIARDPSRIPTHVRERIEIVEGSHGDADIVQRAFEGADAVFWLPPPNPLTSTIEAAFLDFTRPACEAFKSAGVRRVVGISALGRGTGLEGNAGMVTVSLAMDNLIASTGVAYRPLTMPSFIDNMLRQVQSIGKQGMFFSPLTGDRKHPTCATRDIATVAARRLLDHFWSGSHEVPVLGPEDLSQEDMARIMSEALGKPVRFQQIPIDAFKAQLLERGSSEAFAQGIVDMMIAKDNGLDDGETRTPENTTPTSFRQWCEEVLKPAVAG
ncbi:MAG: NAD-dependent epimerase/dehydratase family protein [Rhizobium sp.]|nr:NAD-dependent epimerase/dehydratase family protein [Rhizobium sp.]